MSDWVAVVQKHVDYWGTTALKLVNLHWRHVNCPSDNSSPDNSSRRYVKIPNEESPNEESPTSISPNQQKVRT